MCLLINNNNNNNGFNMSQLKKTPIKVNLDVSVNGLVNGNGSRNNNNNKMDFTPSVTPTMFRLFRFYMCFLYDFII